jgi:hypothetical protein
MRFFSCLCCLPRGNLGFSETSNLAEPGGGQLAKFTLAAIEE